MLPARSWAASASRYSPGFLPRAYHGYTPTGFLRPLRPTRFPST